MPRRNPSPVVPSGRRGAVLYPRVSSVDQVRGTSLETQETRAREYCAAQGWEIVAIFREEGESAKTADRTALHELLDFCRKNRSRIAAVVVDDVDRFARCQEDHWYLRAALREWGITLRFVHQPGIDDSPEGRLFEGIKAALAEYDNAARTRRTVGGMKAAASKGCWVWPAPIGYRTSRNEVGASLVPVQPLASLVTASYRLMAEGLVGQAEALSRMAELGLKDRRGRALHPWVFRKLLGNPVYRGRLVCPIWGIDRSGNWPPLVDDQTWHRVQGVLAGSAQVHVPHVKNRDDFPLRGFVRCDSCGRPVTASYSRSATGQRYGYYHCDRGCKAVRVGRDRLERVFVAHLSAHSLAPELARLFRRVVGDVWRNATADRAARRAALEGQLEEEKRKRRRLEDLVIDGTFDRATFVARSEELRRKISELEQRLSAQVEVSEKSLEECLEFSERLLVQPAQLWLRAGLDNRQRLQQAYFPGGVYYRNGETRTPLNSSIFEVLKPSTMSNQRWWVVRDSNSGPAD